MTVLDFIFDVFFSEFRCILWTKFNTPITLLRIKQTTISNIDQIEHSLHTHQYNCAPVRMLSISKRIYIFPFCEPEPFWYPNANGTLLKWQIHVGTVSIKHKRRIDWWGKNKSVSKPAEKADTKTLWRVLFYCYRCLLLPCRFLIFPYFFCFLDILTVWLGSLAQPTQSRVSLVFVLFFGCFPLFRLNCARPDQNCL